MPDLVRADEPDAGDDGAARGLGELDAGQGRRPPHRRASSPTPSPTDRQRSEVADALRLADHWLDSATEFPSGRHARPRPGAAPSGSSRPSTSGRCSSSRSPSTSSSAMGNALPAEAQAMAGPLIGHARPGRRRDVRQPGRRRRSAGSPARCSAPPTSACRSARPARPRCCRPTSRRSPTGSTSAEDDVLLYLALREAAHQRLFAHVPWLRGHLIAAVEDYGRGTTIDMSKIESSMRDIDPTNPAVHPGGAGGRAVRAREDPGAAGRADPARDRRSRWSRAGSTRSSARPPTTRMPAAAQAAGGGPPPPRRRRPGRADVRRAGRPRAAAAPAARRLRAVGLAALPPGPGGPRRGLGAPRPAARPPPTSTTRSASARAPCPRPRRSPTTTSTPRWPSCSTTSPASAERRHRSGPDAA